MFEKEIMQDVMNIKDDKVKSYLIAAALHPDLPTIVNVSRKVVGKDESCKRWGGVVGNSCVREYTIKDLGDGMQYIYKDDPEPLEAYLQEAGYTEGRIARELLNIEWQKAVFLDVNAEWE